jgi:hypothetical protein
VINKFEKNEMKNNKILNILTMITVAELCPFKFSKIFNNLIAHVTVLCSKKLNITKIDIYFLVH